ncbi:MAG: hypothetical protein VXZ96_00905 [Myxococcota bacterium]|nr:hypothetical protein [Myxococcota bacterium]
MNRYGIGLVILIPAGLALLASGVQFGVSSILFQTLLTLLLFLAGLALLHVVKVQNRFKGVVGFTKIMMLCWLIAELLYRSEWPFISQGKVLWVAGMSGALTVISILGIALIRLRFPYPENPETQQTPVLNHCPSCGLKLQRQYNPNACPSCGAVFKVRWLDRLPFR